MIYCLKCNGTVIEIEIKNKIIWKFNLILITNCRAFTWIILNLLINYCQNLNYLLQIISLTHNYPVKYQIKNSLNTSWLILDFQKKLRLSHLNSW